MKRRDLLRLGAMSGASTLLPKAVTAQDTGRTDSGAPPFPLEELTLAGAQQAMAEGRLSAAHLCEAYLRRIAQLDQAGPAVNSVLEQNPDALASARALDAERLRQGARGPLHGIPVLLKDNIDTADKMQTTAGSLALAGTRAPRDAFVVQRLRAAGAVILGKTNMSEWANFRSARSASGWSARGGQTRNPYILDRNPCGSSSGSGAAVAANLTMLSVGTETDGSVVCPASACGIVGIKPTVGLVSRAGIIPIAHSQDTAGPMARTVSDAAALLSAVVGVDPDDPATAAQRGHAQPDYRAHLNHEGLKGARIGVVRQLLGFHDGVDQLIEAALATMSRAGATIVDPVALPTWDDLGEPEFQVLLYEFKADLEAYLRTPERHLRHRSLAELIAFNEANAAREMPYFGQELFLKALEKGPLSERPYRKALALAKRLAGPRGIDRALTANRLDALLAATGGPAWTTDWVNGDHFVGGSSSAAAVAGYPNITVPAGAVHGLPVGISLFAGAYAEPKLISLAFAYEQASNKRRPPTFRPTLTDPA